MHDIRTVLRCHTAGRAAHRRVREPGVSLAHGVPGGAREAPAGLGRAHLRARRRAQLLALVPGLLTLQPPRTRRLDVPHKKHWTYSGTRNQRSNAAGSRLIQKAHACLFRCHGAQQSRIQAARALSLERTLARSAGASPCRRFCAALILRLVSSATRRPLFQAARGRARLRLGRASAPWRAGHARGRQAVTVSHLLLPAQACAHAPARRAGSTAWPATGSVPDNARPVCALCRLWGACCAGSMTRYAWQGCPRYQGCKEAAAPKHHCHLASGAGVCLLKLNQTHRAKTEAATSEHQSELEITSIAKRRTPVCCPAFAGR